MWILKRVLSNLLKLFCTFFLFGTSESSSTNEIQTVNRWIQKHQEWMNEATVKSKYVNVDLLTFQIYWWYTCFLIGFIKSSCVILSVWALLHPARFTWTTSSGIVNLQGRQTSGDMDLCLPSAHSCPVAFLNVLFYCCNISLCSQTEASSRWNINV